MHAFNITGRFHLIDIYIYLKATNNRFLRLFSAGANLYKNASSNQKKGEKNQKAVIVTYMIPSEVF